MTDKMSDAGFQVITVYTVLPTINVLHKNYLITEHAQTA